MTSTEFRTACAILHISQAEMARRLKVTPQTTTRWANGVTPIPYPAELAIAKLLDDHRRDRDDAGEDKPE